jgi:phage N-6-adenine-methyltransferase
MNKKTQKVMFSSKKDDWETPRILFDTLNDQYGEFLLDVCATSVNTKYLYFFTKEQDGLSQEWHWAKKVWMNPPYGREIGKWVSKANEESESGALVVCLLPSRTCTSWFHDYIYNKPRVEVHFIRGRVRFVGAKFLAPFPSMVVVFHPPKVGK